MPAGAKQVFDEARGWYNLYDAPDRIKWVVGPGPHGTPLVLREAIYEWMIRWLKDGKGDWHEQPVNYVPARMLSVTSKGQVALEPGSRDVYQVIADTPKSPKSPAEMIAQIKTWVQYEKRAPVVKSDMVETHGIISVEQVVLETEPGLNISLTFDTGTGGSGRKPTYLVLESFPHAREVTNALRNKGYVAAVLSVRGRPIPPNSSWPGDWITNTRAWLIGRNLPGMRALDILRAVDYLESRPDVDPAQIRVVASDVPGIWVLLAAAIDSRISAVYLDRTPYTYKQALEGPLHANLHEAALPGFALHWDITDLAATMKGRKLVWHDPTDWMRNLVYAGDSFAYSTGNAPVELWEMPDYLQ